MRHEMPLFVDYGLGLPMGDCLFSIVALTCIMVKCHHCFHMDGIQKLKKSRSNVAIDQQIMQISALSEIICRGHQHIVVGA